MPIFRQIAFISAWLRPAPVLPPLLLFTGHRKCSLGHWERDWSFGSRLRAPLPFHPVPLIATQTVGHSVFPVAAADFSASVAAAPSLAPICGRSWEPTTATFCRAISTRAAD